MRRDDLPACGLYLLGFDIEGLSSFSEVALLHAPVSCDVGGDFDLLPICIRQDRRVESFAVSAKLNVKRPRQKK